MIAKFNLSTERDVVIFCELRPGEHHPAFRVDAETVTLAQPDEGVSIGFVRGGFLPGTRPGVDGVWVDVGGVWLEALPREELDALKSRSRQAAGLEPPLVARRGAKPPRTWADIEHVSGEMLEASSTSEAKDTEELAHEAVRAIQAVLDAAERFTEVAASALPATEGRVRAAALRSAVLHFQRACPNDGSFTFPGGPIDARLVAALNRQTEALVAALRRQRDVVEAARELVSSKRGGTYGSNEWEDLEAALAKVPT